MRTDYEGIEGMIESDASTNFGKSELEKLQEQNALLRQALEGVEWVQFDGMEFAICPSCSCLEDEGHSFGCLLKHALEKEN